MRTGRPCEPWWFPTRKVRASGMDEQTTESVVGATSGATSPLVTRDMLRADMYRALWIQGSGIVAVIGGIIAIAAAIG